MQMTLENHGALIPTDGGPTISLRFEIWGTELLTSTSDSIVVPNPCSELSIGTSGAVLTPGAAPYEETFRVFRSITESGLYYEHFQQSGITLNYRWFPDGQECASGPLTFRAADASEGLCSDTHNGANDSNGNRCNPPAVTYCQDEQVDDYDFLRNVMCCQCGGGTDFRVKTEFDEGSVTLGEEFYVAAPGEHWLFSHVPYTRTYEVMSGTIALGLLIKITI